jgi:hypothetical protein
VNDIDTGASAQRDLMRETARHFAQREIRPIAGELDESERFPDV